jgi:hypothetical protein
MSRRVDHFLSFSFCLPVQPAKSAYQRHDHQRDEERDK